MAPWHHDTMAPWHHGTMAACNQGPSLLVCDMCSQSEEETSSSQDRAAGPLHWQDSEGKETTGQG